MTDINIDGSKLLSDALPRSSAKSTQGFIEDAFRERGWLLRSKYKNNSEKLEFTCDRGHHHKISWKNFRKGQGCAYCAGMIVTHEQVEAAFQERGWTLHSQYGRANQKLEFTCDRGHKHAIRWGGFQQGGGCAYCAGMIVTHEQVEAAFQERGWNLHSQYVKSSQKLDFTCDRGHQHQISWASFRKGTGCAHCSGMVVTHEQVEIAFQERGWLLRSSYRGAYQALDFTCDRGHQYQISWTAFQQGQGCAHCSGMVVTHEQVETAFQERGWLLRSKYKNNSEKLEFTCDRGHEHQISWGKFRQGKGCIYCAGMVVTHEQVEAEFNQRGWELLSKYERAHQRLEFVCDRGHQHQISYHSFKQHTGCGLCNPGGYNREHPGRLYYIRFDFPDRPPLYKIGVTNRTVKARFSTEKSPYTVLLDEWHKDGSISYDKEQTLLKRYKKYQYKGPKLLESGDTECFTKDVLGLDKPMAQLPLPLDVA